MKRFTILLGLAVLFLAPVVLADVPKLINFQGILRDGSGNPVPDAVYVIRFRIYDDSTAGANLWEEFDDVQTTDGFFNVRLGDTTDLPNGLFEGSVNRFVGVKVGGDPETAPRTRLISVPFAFHALNSDSAATATVALDLTCTGCVVGGVSGTILDGSITSEDLGTNSVAADEIAPGAVSTSEIDATQVQRRVTGTAGANQYITAINQDGSVVTAADQVGAASGWTDDGAVVRLSTGTDNVGVGTAAPLSNLHIFEDVNADVGLRIENPNAGLAAQERIDFGDGAAHINVLGSTNEMSIVNNRTSGTLEFHVGGTPRLFIGNGGNVGIGTLGPANKLDVEGGAVVGANYSGSFSAPANGLLVEGNVGIGSISPSTRLEVAAGQISVLGGTATAPGYAFAADLNTGVFRPSADVIGFTINGAEQMRISPTGNVGLGATTPANKLDVEGGAVIGTTYSGTNVAPANGLLVEGNVGLGTTTPANKLDVEGGAVIGATYSGSFTAPANGLLVQGNVGIGSVSPPTSLTVATGQISVAGGTAAAPGYAFGADLITGIFRPSADVIGFSTNGAEQVRIAPTGNVGVGTTSPANKLDVEGGAVIGAAYSGTNTAPANGLLVEGNVGIGTTSPSATLHIFRSAFPSLTFDDAGATDWTLTHDGSNINMTAGGATRTRFLPGGNVHFGITGGNIGIGTESPLTRLHVEASGADVATFNRTTNDGVIIRLDQAGITEGTISVAGTTVTYGAFTGSHYGWTEEALARGELVTLNGINRNSHNNPKSEIIYGIKRSSLPNDPACLGSYLALSESSKPYSSENPHLVMAVGNGDMWVVDEGQNIEPGDYLISSSTPGHAMKDDEEKFPIGHIVARAAEGVDWSTVSEMAGGRKHKKISVLFGNFVRSNPSTVAQTLEGLREIILKQQQEIEKLKDAVFKDGPSEMAETGR